MSGYLQGRTVFVSGATGMAGSALLERLLQEHPDTAIRAGWHRSAPFLHHARIRYVQGDQGVLADCRRMIAGCDAVVMAAAFTGGAALTRVEPWRHIRENLEMNLQMLEACHLEGVKRVIYVGSATLYQEYEGFIREEALDLNAEPAAAYGGFGWTIRYLERMCRFWHDQTGLEVVIFRCANIYGPYARFDPARSNFIPALIRKAVERMDPFEVWGSPEVTRDVIYAGDFARAVLMALDAGERICYAVYNLGSGVRTTVGEVVACALKQAGHTPGAVLYRSDRPTTLTFRALECGKIRRELGWVPEFSLEAGIAATTAWWQSNRHHWKS